MTVNEWFNSEQNYKVGVSIYTTLPNAKPNLVRLFLIKESSYNKQKLVYELEKHKSSTAAVTIQSDVTSSNEIVHKTHPPINESDSLYRAVRISDFPIELHPVFKQKNLDFYEMCSLKVQLNEIPGEEAFNDEALEIILKIDALDEAVIKAWKILDHYTETKNVIVSKGSSFSDLTPEKRLQTRNYRRASLSKTKAKLKKLQSVVVSELTLAQKTKYERELEKTKTKIIELEVDIKDLTDLIEGK